jgi:hypothetical protein
VDPRNWFLSHVTSNEQELLLCRYRYTAKTYFLGSFLCNDSSAKLFRKKFVLESSPDSCAAPDPDTGIALPFVLEKK